MIFITDKSVMRKTTIRKNDRFLNGWGACSSNLSGFQKKKRRQTIKTRRFGIAQPIDYNEFKRNHSLKTIAFQQNI